MNHGHIVFHGSDQCLLVGLVIAWFTIRVTWWFLTSLPFETTTPPAVSIPLDLPVPEDPRAELCPHMSMDRNPLPCLEPLVMISTEDAQCPIHGRFRWIPERQRWIPLV